MSRQYVMGQGLSLGQQQANKPNQNDAMKRVMKGSSAVPQASNFPRYFISIINNVQLMATLNVSLLLE